MSVTLKLAPEKVRGFNFHPTYSFGANEDWVMFDYSVWEKELLRGKELFPNMNTIRVWLSWNAWCKLEDRFITYLRQVVELCKANGIYVIPSIFNRWHDPMIDGDGIYIDHFLPGSSWLLKYGDPFGEYIDALAKEFKDEEQILVWDLCNEPLAYDVNFPLKDVIMPYELDWLRRMADRLRAGGITQPIGIGSTGDQSMNVFGDICDVYLTHMYCRSEAGAPVFEETVRTFAAEAKANGKPLIVSECCWGALDDLTRAKLVRITLDIFKKYDIGFVVHALQYSPRTDLHYREDGRMSPDVGNLSFMSKDGNIRPGHEIYCDY